jgi:hypothetical protein
VDGIFVLRDVRNDDQRRQAAADEDDRDDHVASPEASQPS